MLAAASLVVGWLIAGRFLRPLRTITATARDISASNLNRRLEPGARDNEFAELGDTLNGLFGRLEASFDSQRRFVANASHELRTPLSAGRALLQVALADPDATVDSLQGGLPGSAGPGRSAGAPDRGAAHPGHQPARPGPRPSRWTWPTSPGRVLAAREHDAERRGIQVSAALDRGPGHRRPEPGREPDRQPGWTTPSGTTTRAAR